MNPFDLVFVLSGIVFHLVIAGIYVASKHERFDLVRKLGNIVITLALPVSIVLAKYWMTGRPPKILLYLAAVLV